MENIYASINNGVVTNTFIGTESFVNSYYPDAIRIDTLQEVPSIGWTYENGLFYAPIPPTPPTPEPKSWYTKLEFRTKFTLEELVGIDNFMLSPTLTNQQKATINSIIKTFDSSGDSVYLLSDLTIFGVNYLVDCGLLTQQRATEILTPGENYALRQEMTP